MKTVTRNIGTSWRQVTQDEERPHAGRFEQMTLDAERSMRLASDRLELIDQCRRLINPGPNTEACMYEVTQGGLTYQDAALQCLLGGCVETLEQVSRRAAGASHVGEALMRHHTRQRRETRARRRHEELAPYSLRMPDHSNDDLRLPHTY